MNKTAIQNIFNELFLKEALPTLAELKNLFNNNNTFKEGCRLVSAASYADPDIVLSEGPDVSYHFRKLENYFPEVKRICDAASKALGKTVNVHAIYTQAESRGFPVHYDFEDVMVYQKSGSKIWKIWKPYREQITVVTLAHDQKHGVLEQWSKISPSNEFDLNPTDTLFIPRGHPHLAWTNAEDSLHYSFTFS